ncbi:MAG: hypothetical protein HYT68_00560 [Candidatus Zambryskibacteria bacterium]|nr:hypothetical protein [Candidatus Zambryskibacteria bacterium]
MKLSLKIKTFVLLAIISISTGYVFSVNAFDTSGNGYSSSISEYGSKDIVDGSGQLYYVSADYTIYFPEGGRVCAGLYIFNSCVNVPAQNFTVYYTVGYELGTRSQANDTASLFWDTESSGGAVNASTRVRKVEITDFSSNNSSAEVGQSFTVSWNTDQAENVDLLWGGPVGSGSQGNSGSSGSRNFTCSSVGTATFELRAEGPTANGLDTVNRIIAVDCNQAPVNYVDLNFYVTDSCTSNPVSGASANIDQNFGNGTNRTTDGSGFANFGVESNSNIGWSVSASGFSGESGNIGMSGGNKNLNVVLTRSCGSPPPPPSSSPISCSGPYSVQTNTYADFIASGGNGSFSWNFTGNADYIGGSTANFSARWPSAGDYVVTVDDRSTSDSCNIVVTSGSPPPPPPPPPGAAACSPKNQTVQIGQTANLTGSIVGGGSGNINWSAPGGSPSSKNNSNTFSTTYSSAGYKTVTASTSGGKDTCTVKVDTTGPPPPPQTFSVSAPSCSNSSYAATVNWPGYPPDPTYGYFVDVSKTNTFSSFWNKRITNGATQTQALDGFTCTAANFCSSPPSWTTLDPGTDYYFRVWNGSHIPSSTGYKINVPRCDPVPILKTPVLPNTCEDPYTVTLDWSGPPSPAPDPTYGFFADVTTDQSFSTFWNKKLSGSTFTTQALTGFSCTSANFCPGAPQNSPPPSNAIQLNRGTWYYARIFGKGGHSNIQPFKLNACSAYTLTAVIGSGLGTITGQGISCPGDCSQTYAPGSQTVSLTATPASGYTFGSWSGGAGSVCSGSPSSCSAFIDGNKTATANFTAQVATLNVNSSGTSGVSITRVSGTAGTDGVTNYTRTSSGSNISTVLRAPSASGSFTFSSWSSGCDSVGGSGGRDCTVTVNTTQTKTITANYLAVFNYSLSNSGTSNVTRTGGNAFTQNTITKTLISGATQSVTLALSGVPNGTTPSISSSSCSPTCTSVITFTVAPSTANGTYAITVTGSPLNKQTTFNLVVSGNPVSVSCAASPSTALIGETVTWSANVSGATPPLTYSWSGTNIPTNPAPNTNPFNISYSTIGQKTATVRVTDADSNQATCPAAVVQINFDPLFEEF